ncbi:hypothetical protein PR048_033393 [Dryococelus australis]|uniref:Uncharacterized protein n=1 Tax=Dryococelus australis TaxID=614101 RepID=A0ABQ9G058_9NEOP|nr:hypothetical protein PR048_033393 [Dryococelus australis]
MLAQSSASTVTAGDQCAVDISLFLHKTVKSSLQVIELAAYDEPIVTVYKHVLIVTSACLAYTAMDSHKHPTPLKCDQYHLFVFDVTPQLLLLTPFLSELLVIGAHGCGAFIYWRRVTRGVSNKDWPNDKRIAEEKPFKFYMSSNNNANFAGKNGAPPECKGGGKRDIPEKNPRASGIVWHDSHFRKSGSDPAGDRTRFALVGGRQDRRCRAVSPLASHQSEPGSIPGRVTGFSHVGIVLLVGGFSRGSPVSPAISFRCCSILTSIILIGSQDLAVKSHPNLFTYFSFAIRLSLDEFLSDTPLGRSLGTQSLRVQDRSNVSFMCNTLAIVYNGKMRRVWSSAGMKGRRGEGDTRENPPTSGIIRRDPRVRKSGIRPGRGLNPVRRALKENLLIPTRLMRRERTKLNVEHTLFTRLEYPPPTKANRDRITAGSVPGFRMQESCQTMPLVGAFSRGYLVPPVFEFRALLHTHLTSPSSALKTSLLRTVQISQLNYTLKLNHGEFQCFNQSNVSDRFNMARSHSSLTVKVGHAPGRPTSTLLEALSLLQQDVAVVTQRKVTWAFDSSLAFASEVSSESIMLHVNIGIALCRRHKLTATEDKVEVSHLYSPLQQHQLCLSLHFQLASSHWSWLRRTRLLHSQPTSFFHWLLRRRHSTPFRNEPHVIGTYNCEVFDDWRSVSQGVSDRVWCNDSRITKSSNRKQGHGGCLVSLLASHQGEPGSTPGRVSGFSYVGIVPDDAAGQRVFSGISRFPRPSIPAPIPCSPQSLSSALKISLLRTAQISPLTHSNVPE